MPPRHWDLCDVFSWSDWGNLFLGGKPQRESAILMASCQGNLLPTWLILDDAKILITWLRVCQISPLQRYHHPWPRLFRPVLLAPTPRPPRKEWGVVPHPHLKGGTAAHLIWDSSGETSLSPLFIFLNHSLTLVWICGYSLYIWVIIQRYFIDCSKPGPALASFSGLLCPLDILPSLQSFSSWAFPYLVHTILPWAFILKLSKFGGWEWEIVGIPLKSEGLL